MVYPVRSYRCGGNSDSKADIVTTNSEKAAEVIVRKNFREGPNGKVQRLKISIVSLIITKKARKINLNSEPNYIGLDSLF